MSLKIKTSKVPIKEGFVLEELFLDQLIFKLGAVINLYTFEKKSRREIVSFISQLKDLTHENLVKIAAINVPFLLS